MHRRYIIKIKIHSSCEIEYFVETHPVYIAYHVLGILCSHLALRVSYDIILVLCLILWVVPGMSRMPLHVKLFRTTNARATIFLFASPMLYRYPVPATLLSTM